jgi:hypothetical protein
MSRNCSHPGASEQPRVLSLTPGRLRLHLPAWAGHEAGLRRLPGVRDVQASPLTGNVLVHFDPRATTAQALVAAAGGLGPGPGGAAERAREGPSGGSAALRAGLTGLLGHALVDTVFYAVVFAEPFGLPLAGLGVLHLGLDVLAWTVALVPLLGWAASALDGDGRPRVYPAPQGQWA